MSWTGAEGAATEHQAMLPWRSLVILLHAHAPSHMTSEGARRAPCTDCETVIRQSAVVPQYRKESDVPETVGRVHRLCIHIEGVHDAKETALCREGSVFRLFSFAADTKAHIELSASVCEGRNGRPRLLKLEFS